MYSTNELEEVVTINESVSGVFSIKSCIALKVRVNVQFVKSEKEKKDLTSTKCRLCLDHE